MNAKYVAPLLAIGAALCLIAMATIAKAQSVQCGKRAFRNLYAWAGGLARG